MADEEKVENPEATENAEAPKKKGLMDKIRESNKKALSSNQTKAVQGRDLSVEEKGKIKALATDFWNSYGKDHQDDVQSWANHEKGQKLIKHFVSDGKNQELYTNCDAYKNCFDAYQKANGDKNYNYDEASVDFSRLQTPYDVSFYIVLDGFPDWLLSTTNQHTKNFVMSRFKEGDSLLSIVKVANEKLGKSAKASKDDKDAQKDGNESESEEKQEEQKSEEEIQEEHKHTKAEFDEFCSDCAKTQLHTRILYGDLSSKYNIYQRSFYRNAIAKNGSLSKESVNVLIDLGNEEKAKEYFINNKGNFDINYFKKFENSLQDMNHKNKFSSYEAQSFNNSSNKKEIIDQVYDSFLAHKNNKFTQLSETEKEQ